MDQYGFIKNGKVINTAIFDNPTPELLEEFRVIHEADHVVLGNERNCEPGADWDGEHFILPKPESNPSFVLDEDFNWVPPIPFPYELGEHHVWNEETLAWDLVPRDGTPHPQLG